MTIKEARKAVGLSQKEMGVLLGVPTRTIENWDSGERTAPEWTQDMIVYMLKEYVNIKNTAKYIVIDDATEFGGMDIFTTICETLQAANVEAEKQWRSLTAAEQKCRHIYVIKVTGADLNLDAIDIYAREIDWDGYCQYDTPVGAFDSESAS